MAKIAAELDEKKKKEEEKETARRQVRYSKTIDDLPQRFTIIFGRYQVHPHLQSHRTNSIIFLSLLFYCRNY